MLHKYINESEAINQRLKGFIWYDCSLYRIFIRLLTNTWMESNEEVDEKRDEEKAVCTFVFVWIVTKRLNVPQRRCIGVFVYICVQFIYRNVVGLYVLNVEKSSNIVVTTAPKPVHMYTCIWWLLCYHMHSACTSHCVWESTLHGILLFDRIAAWGSHGVC